MSSGIGGFLAGLAAGAGTTLRFANEIEDRKDRREERAFSRAQRERLLKQQSQDDEHRQAVRNAAADVGVTELREQRPATMDDRDVGQSGEAPLPAAGFAVGGTRFADREAADAAAAKANTSAARVARVAGVMRGAGRFGEAQQLEAGERQGALAEAQFNELQRQEAARAFGRGAAEAMSRGGWAGAARFATQKYDDGFRYEAIENPNGGATIRRIGADGKETGAQTFESREDFLMYAMTKADPTRYVDWRTGRKDRADDRQRDDTRRAEDVQHRGRVFDAEKQHRNAVLAMERQKLEAAAAPRPGNEPQPQMPQFNEADARKRADSYVAEQNKQRLAAGQPAMSAQEVASARQQLINAERVEWGNEMALTAAGNSLRAASSDPAAYAATWQLALDMGIPAAVLTARGFAAPRGATAPAPTAAAAQGGVPQRRSAGATGPGAPSGSASALAAVQAQRQETLRNLAASHAEFKRQLADAAESNAPAPVQIEKARAVQMARDALLQQIGPMDDATKAALLQELGVN
jgi:hypothetical protein